MDGKNLGVVFFFFHFSLSFTFGGWHGGPTPSPKNATWIFIRNHLGEISQSARDLCALWRDRRIANWQEMASFVITGLTFGYRYLTIYVCIMHEL